MITRARRVVSLLAIALVAACSGDSPASLTENPSEPNTPPTGEPELRIVGDEQLLEIGTRITLQIDPRISRWRNIWWYTSKSSVARVSSGRVDAVGDGQATISALSLGGLQTWSVSTYSRSTAVLEVSPTTPNVEVGQSVGLETQLRTSYGEVFPLSDATYSVVNTAIATVSGGRLIGTSRGSTTMRATARSMTRDLPVTVGAASAPAPEPTPPPPSATIIGFRMSPRGALTLQPGASQQFSATTTWSDGQARAANVSYAASGGTVDAGGLYRAPTGAGTYLVIGAPEGSTLRDTARVTVEAPAPTLTALAISPATASLETGGTQQFAATGTWSDGQARALSVTYSAPSGGTVSSGGLFTAPATAGTYRVVVAEVGGMRRDTATVSVSAPAPTPTLTSFIISPQAASLQTGGTQQFAVATTWSDGQARAVSVAYSAPNGGTVSSSGLFTAPATAGTYRVVAAEVGGTSRDTATVTVSAPAPAATLTSFAISPKTGSLQTGGTQQFAVATTWSDGQARAVSVAYSAPNGGTVSSSGLFTAPATAGTYRVVAAAVGGTSRDTATVTVSAPTLTRLTISPQTVSMQTGATQQFAVSGLLSNGTTTTPTVTWSRIGSGSVSSTGLYTAPALTGTFRVVATSGSLADTATVTVTAPAPTVSSFTLSPASVTLSTGGTRQFATAVQWSDGQSRSVTVSYQATGGTISVGGLYTAGQVAGSFLVIATCSCGAADTSAVVISAPQLSTLSITPETASVQTGAQQQFGATAQWSTGSTTLPPLAWSVIGGSANGTVSSTGLYTAPGTAGTYRVVVAHSGGTLRDTATVTVGAPATQPPPPTSGGQWDLSTNLPAGLTLRSDNPHSSVVPSGWGGIAQRSSQTPTIVSDPSDPTGGGSVLRQFWGGVPDGQSPNFLYRSTPVTHIFVSTVARIPSSLMPPNEVKWLNFVGSGGSIWLGFYGAQGTHGYNRGLRGAETEMLFNRRAGGDLLSQRVGSQQNIPTGQWVKVQVELRISPARVRLWINDVLVQQETSSWSWEGMTNFGEFQLGSVWGGGNGVSAPAGAVIDYARTAVWTN